MSTSVTVGITDKSEPRARAHETHVGIIAAVEVNGGYTTIQSTDRDALRELGHALIHAASLADEIAADNVRPALTPRERFAAGGAA